MIQAKSTYGLYIMYDRTMAAIDFATCSGVERKSRDSRDFALVVTGMLSIFRRLLPAWMIVSMQ